MPASSLDLLAFGNAIMDVIATTDDRFLVDQGLAKGTMQLIDEVRAEELYGLMGGTTLVSGGSAANTAAGAASFGLRAGFVGKVRDDVLGGHYAHDLTAVGVAFDTEPAREGPATARSFILVTPDGERTMNTYLGACQNLAPADVHADTVRAARTIYLEGYLWDPPAAKDAFRKAVAIAHEAGNTVALSLSDPFCVDRYRDEFLDLIRNGSVDLLFANSHELRSLFQTADENAAVTALRAERVTGIVTRSAAGAFVVSAAGVESVPAAPVAQVVDSTGAGDLFAAGYLAGFARDLPAADCARLGALAAAEVIGHVGARPLASLSDLAAASGLALRG